MLSFLVMCSALASAGEPSVAPVMAVAVQGAVQVAPPGAAAWALSPFSRVRAGDTLQVPAGGSVQLVFQASGRRETWTGPAEVVVGAAEGVGAGAPVVATMGAGARQELGTLAVMLTRAEQERGGTTMIRGDGAAAPVDFVAQAEIDAARAAYDAAAAAPRGPGDIAPEMLLAAVLLKHDQYVEACEPLRAAEAACGCAPPATLLDWIGREGCE